MDDDQGAPVAVERTYRKGVGLTSLLLAGVALLALSSPTEALTITPTFGTGTNATIDGAINAAIATIDGLYSNNVTLPVTFTYTPATTSTGCKTCILQSTGQTGVKIAYSSYTSALQADSTANPQNTVLSTAVAHLGSGNGANGLSPVVLSGSQFAMLTGNATFVGATININSNVLNFSFTSLVSGSQFDGIGALEHELDEVLGGGGAGSTLNGIKAGIPFFTGALGPTDLYRYSAPGTPSHTTSSAASSYFSIDGGVTNIVGFNQWATPPAGCPGGDYGDFAPNGAGAGQHIQNACNTTGKDADYTTSSPEFIMEASIGWNPQAVPAPSIGVGSRVFLAVGGLLFGVGLLRRRRPHGAPEPA